MLQPTAPHGAYTERLPVLQRRAPMVPTQGGYPCCSGRRCTVPTQGALSGLSGVSASSFVLFCDTGSHYVVLGVLKFTTHS